MALERFWWGPSLDMLWDSRNGALWLEHYKLGVKVVNDHCNHSTRDELKGCSGAIGLKIICKEDIGVKGLCQRSTMLKQ